MTDVFLSPANFWFSISISAVFLILVLEVISILFGISLLGLGDDVADLDSAGSTGSEFANWLNINKVPFLIWLIVLLTLFSLSGFVINGLGSMMFASSIPSLVSLPLAATLGVVITAKLVPIIAYILPSIESSAMSNDEFVGAVAQITLGHASRGNPAEAKFTDRYSQPHFVLVEPFEDAEYFTQGEQVILVQKNEHSWLATRYQ